MSTPLSHLNNTDRDKEKTADKPTTERAEKKVEKEAEKEKDRGGDKPLRMSGSLTLKKHHGKVGRGRPRKVDKEAREALMTAALTHTVQVSLTTLTTATLTHSVQVSLKAMMTAALTHTVQVSRRH